MNGVVGMAAAGIGVGAVSGADNLRAAAGLTLVDPIAARRWVRRLIVADAAGLVVGATVGMALPVAIADIAPVIGLGILAVFAIVAIVGADDLTERLVGSQPLSVAVPVLLSVDNLIAGAALGTLGYPLLAVVPIAVVTSSIVCFAGYAAAAAVHTWRLSGSSARLGGAILGIAVVIAGANG
jgi:hypothetical protein